MWIFREEEGSVKHRRNEIGFRELRGCKTCYSHPPRLSSLCRVPLSWEARGSLPCLPLAKDQTELHLPGSHGGWAENGSRINHVPICTGLVIDAQNHMRQSVLKITPILFHCLVLCLLLCNGGGQGSLAGCSPWGCKESDKTEWLNNVG